jgi:hypothetical protein
MNKTLQKCDFNWCFAVIPKRLKKGVSESATCWFCGAVHRDLGQWGSKANAGGSNGRWRSTALRRATAQAFACYATALVYAGLYCCIVALVMPASKSSVCKTREYRIPRPIGQIGTGNTPHEVDCSSGVQHCSSWCACWTSVMSIREASLSSSLTRVVASTTWDACFLT